MSLQAAAYGRLSADAETKTTKSGKEMATANLAVDVAPYNFEGDERPTMWLSVAAFNFQATALARCKKGGLISVSGKISQSSWTTQAGETRVGWNMMADSVISAKTVRPYTGGKKADTAPAKQEPFFNDPISF